MPLKLQFNATHRVLIKANTAGHGYKTIRIDVNNGTFYNDIDVDSKDTKIRVNKGIRAEKLCYNGDNDYNKPLKDSTALKVINEFNIKRTELGFVALEFYRVKDVKSEN
jgi:hypothetical protein